MTAQKVIFQALKEVTVTTAVVQQFAKIVGDNNPVHLNDEAAKDTRFGKRIAHGMIGVSYALSLIPKQYEYKELQVKFKKPVFLQQNIKINISMLETNEITITINKMNKEKQETVTEVRGKWISNHLV